MPSHTPAERERRRLETAIRRRISIDLPVTREIRGIEAGAPSAGLPIAPPVIRAGERRGLFRRSLPAIRRALGTALTGFSAGVSGVGPEAGEDPVAGGIVGGLRGLGRLQEARRRERLELEEPARRVAIAEQLERGRRIAREPFEIRQEERRQTGRVALQELRGTQARKRRDELRKLSKSDPTTFRLAVNAVNREISQNPLSRINPPTEEEISNRIQQRFNNLRAIRAGKAPPRTAAPAQRRQPATANEFLQRGFQ